MATLLIPTDTSQATLGYLLADGTIPLTANWAVGDFSLTGINSLEFTDATSGGIGVSGDLIQTQNLLDKTAAESISGAYTHTVGMVIDGTADENQLRIQAHSTQTSDIFVVENSGGTDFLVVDGAGKVGVNTDPRYQFHVNTGTNQNMQFRPGISGGTGILLNAANDADSANIKLEIRGGPVVITAGDVGIGTSSPLSIFHVASTTARFMLEQTNAATDEKLWNLPVIDSGQMRYETINDSNSGPVRFWVVERTGTAVDSQAFSPHVIVGATTDGLTVSGILHVDQTSTTGAEPCVFLDQADVSEQGIKFSSSGSDIDINLFTVDVTGTPKLSWDESADDFIFSTGVQVESREVNRYAYSVG